MVVLLNPSFLMSQESKGDKHEFTSIQKKGGICCCQNTNVWLDELNSATVDVIIQ